MASIAQHLQELDTLYGNQDLDLKAFFAKISDRAHKARLLQLYLTFLRKRWETAESQRQLELLAIFLTFKDDKNFIASALHEEPIAVEASSSPQYLQEEQKAAPTPPRPQDLKEKHQEAGASPSPGIGTKISEQFIIAENLLAELKLSAEGRDKLYADPRQLYQQQEQQRPWYLHGAVAIVVAVFLLLTCPFALPFLSRLWWDSRAAEPLHLNPFKPEQLETIKTNRQHFKAAAAAKVGLHRMANYALSVPVITREKGPSAVREPKPVITREKVKRGWFFMAAANSNVILKDDKRLTADKVQLVEKSKREDQALRLMLGIR